MLDFAQMISIYRLHLRLWTAQQQHFLQNLLRKKAFKQKYWRENYLGAAARNFISNMKPSARQIFGQLSRCFVGIPRYWISHFGQFSLPHDDDCHALFAGICTLAHKRRCGAQVKEISSSFFCRNFSGLAIYCGDAASIILSDHLLAFMMIYHTMVTPHGHSHFI